MSRKFIQINICREFPFKFINLWSKWVEHRSEQKDVKWLLNCIIAAIIFNSSFFYKFAVFKISEIENISLGS